jgi:hypothetical protein
MEPTTKSARSSRGLEPDSAGTEHVERSDQASGSWQIPDEIQRSGQRCSRVFRHDYPYKQHIAVCEIGDPLPAWEDFFAVRCAKLSSVGISFYFDEEPEFDSVAVALGRFPFLRFLIAQVVRVEAAADDPSGAYLVSCRFVERVW